MPVRGVWVIASLEGDGRHHHKFERAGVERSPLGRSPRRLAMAHVTFMFAADVTTCAGRADAGKGVGLPRRRLTRSGGKRTYRTEADRDTGRRRGWLQPADGGDEEGTLRALKAHRKTVIDPKIA